MVIESLVNPFKAERKPWELFFVGALYSTVAVFLSLWIFKDYASLVMVFLTVLACVPLFYSTMKHAELKECEGTNEKGILREHSKTLTFFIFIFLGITVSFTLWYVVLPQPTVTNLFTVQTQTIASLNQQVTGGVTQLNVFSRIFLNNIKVLVFALLFSFIYGAGAIFIIVWNSSVIAAASGSFIKAQLAYYFGTVGTTKATAYLYAVSSTTLRYFVHGIPEILAYFIAALAGGIVSVALIKKHFGTKKFEKIALDATDLLLISIIVLFIAALLETYVTPLFF